MAGQDMIPWLMMQLQKLYPGEDAASELHPPASKRPVKSMVDPKPAIMTHGDPSLQQMDAGSDNMPAATTPEEAENPEGDAYQGPHPEPKIYGAHTITRPLGEFSISNMDDLKALRAAKTREELEAIKQQILNHGGTFTPAPEQEQ